MLEGTQIKFFLEIGVQNNPPNNANKSNTNFYLFAVCIDTLHWSSSMEFLTMCNKKLKVFKYFLNPDINNISSTLICNNMNTSDFYSMVTF